jgi:anti-sigma B factor antagonist
MDGSRLGKAMLFCAIWFTKIVLNLGEITYIDSSGLGELVSGYRFVKSEGGEIKLLNLNKKVTDLLQITRLYTVFDIHNQEAQAVASFQA